MGRCVLYIEIIRLHCKAIHVCLSDCVYSSCNCCDASTAIKSFYTFHKNLATYGICGFATI